MIKDKDALISYYFYLEGYLKFNEQIPHSESYCRKSLELLELLFCSDKLQIEFIKEYLPKAIVHFQNICLMRDSAEKIKVLIKL